MSAYEFLVQSMVADLFFVHDRGLCIVLTSFLLVAVSNFSSDSSGPVTEHLGWRYLFHLLIAAAGLLLILLLRTLHGK